MFRFANHGQVFWPVTVRQPAEHGGVEDVTIHVGYNLLTREQLRERTAAVLRRATEALSGAAGKPGDYAALLAQIEQNAIDDKADRDLLLERVTGWMGIADTEGQAEPFSTDKLSALLDYDHLFRPILVGLLEASRVAPAKNSKPGPAGTPAAGLH